MTDNSHSRCGRTSTALICLLMLVLPIAAPSRASAHSLDSSTVAVVIDDVGVTATISVALEAIDDVLGTDYEQSDLDDFGEDLVGYIDDHLEVTGADGVEWGETYSDPERESVEGIDSFSVEVTLDPNGSAFTRFDIAYDAIIEADPDHEAVVVLVDSSKDVSTVGVLTDADTTVHVTDSAHVVPFGDMIHYGFDHVLEGADHLLFLTTLLLPAALVAVAGRWERGDSARRTFTRVVHVITAFTIGHSLTLIASSLGWVDVPSRPVEILIAASVGVSAVHAMRPLTSHGETLIAAGFGLVHGLAFAGILADLGLAGTTSVLTLFAFNIGIELAQLVAAALVFPSLYALSRTRTYPTIRVGAAAIAGAAAIGWMLERLELVDNPLSVVEDAAIAHPWWIVMALAAVASVAVVVDRYLLTGQPLADQTTDTAASRAPRPL